MSDLICRQAAIDALTEYGNGRAVFISVGEAVIRIEQLPPAEPKRETTTLKIGRSRNSVTMWYECAECGEPVDQEDAFCRRCGRGIIHG